FRVMCTDQQRPSMDADTSVTRSDVANCIQDKLIVIFLNFSILISTKEPVGSSIAEQPHCKVNNFSLKVPVINLSSGSSKLTIEIYYFRDTFTENHCYGRGLLKGGTIVTKIFSGIRSVHG